MLGTEQNVKTSLAAILNLSDTIAPVMAQCQRTGFLWPLKPVPPYGTGKPPSRSRPRYYHKAPFNFMALRHVMALVIYMAKWHKD